MSTETRRFTLSLGPLYTGLSSTCKVKVVDNSGTVRVDTISSSPINAGWVSVSEVIPGQYEFAITNFDTSWAGVAYMEETTIPATDSFMFASSDVQAVASLDQYATAFLYGDVTINSDLSWTYFDPGTSVQRMKFRSVASPGGRAVDLY